MPFGSMRHGFTFQAAAVASAARTTPATITTGGNAQVDTAYKKFGTAGLLSDGVGDYIQAPSSYDFQNEDWTFEFWFKNDGQLNRHLAGLSDATGLSMLSCYHQGTSIRIYAGNNSGGWAWNAPITGFTTGGVWNHCAITKSGTQWYGYANGAQTNLYNSSYSYNTTTLAVFGAAKNNGGYDSWPGSMDEMRISNNLRYTGAFTSPTAAFVNDANTLLLIHADGSDGSTTFTDDASAGGGLVLRADTYSANVELIAPFDNTTQFGDLSDNAITPTSGAASTITATQVKWTTPDYAAAYTGTQGLGSALTYTIPGSIPAASSGTYVVEGWFYATNGTSNNNWCLSSSDSGGRWLFGINNNTSFAFGSENNIGNGTGWHHLAIVCDGGTKRCYRDGVYKGAWVSSNTGFSTLHVGQFNAGDSNDYRGHIQDLRVTVGSNRGYTGTNTGAVNFTLPDSLVESF